MKESDQTKWLESKGTAEGLSLTNKARKAGVITKTQRIHVRLEVTRIDLNIEIPSDAVWDEMLKVFSDPKETYAPERKIAIERLRKNQNLPLSRPQLGLRGVSNIGSVLKGWGIEWRLAKHPSIRKGKSPCFFLIRDS